MEDSRPVDLFELIAERSKDRPRTHLASYLGVSSNTVKNWATGATSMPRYQAQRIAAWLEVDESSVLAAAEESRARFEAAHVVPADVGAEGQGESHAHGGRRGVGLMQDERDEIGAVARLLAEAAERLARIAERKPDDQP